MIKPQLFSSQLSENPGKKKENNAHLIERSKKFCINGEEQSCPGWSLLGAALACSPRCAVTLSSRSAWCHLRAFPSFVRFYIIGKIMVLPPCYGFLTNPPPAGSTTTCLPGPCFGQLPELSLTSSSSQTELSLPSSPQHLGIVEPPRSDSVSPDGSKLISIKTTHFSGKPYDS